VSEEPIEKWLWFEIPAEVYNRLPLISIGESSSSVGDTVRDIIDKHTEEGLGDLKRLPPHEKIQFKMQLTTKQVQTILGAAMAMDIPMNEVLTKWLIDELIGF